MKKTINVKVDVDGVIRDIVQNMCDLFKKDFNIEISPDDIDTYDVNDFFGRYVKGRDFTKYFFVDNADVVFGYNYQVYDGVVESLNKLRQTRCGIFKFIVTIVTYQMTNDNKRYCLDFLDKCNIPYDNICFTSDKRVVNGDIIIDDNPKFLNDAVDELRICINKPYNKDCSADIKCDSLKEAVDKILEIFKP